MGDRLGRKGLGNVGGGGRWPRRAVDFDQGVWFLLLVGFIVLVAGVVGLFAELDSAATAAALVSGAALCGLAAVLFSMASPRYMGTATLMAETLFDYTDAKARLGAMEMPDELRDPFRRLARGEAAAAYLEVVLRDMETAQAGGGADGQRVPASVGPAVDAERIAANAVSRAKESLGAAAAGSFRPRRPDPPAASAAPSAPPVSTVGVDTVGVDTLEQPMPHRPGPPDV